MKRILSIFILAAVSLSLNAQKIQYEFTEASDLTLIGKIIDTPNPYHRVDTVKYKGFTKAENIQVRCPAGLAVLFKTNSSTISVKADYGYIGNSNATMGIAFKGYDLYIKKDGKWLFAEANAPKDKKMDGNLVLMSNMPEGEKECMLYLPIYSELYSLKIGVAKGATIEPLESPFRHRVGIFGSSFTHGISTTRSGMSYPMQLMRWTGIQFLSLGCSGNCKMQPYFADVLCDADVDALVFAASFFHQSGCSFLFLLLILIILHVEVAAFTTDCLLEYKRNVRMSGLDLLDEREQSLLNHFCIRI